MAPLSKDTKLVLVITIVSLILVSGLVGLLVWRPWMKKKPKNGGDSTKNGGGSNGGGGSNNTPSQTPSTTPSTTPTTPISDDPSVVVGPDTKVIPSNAPFLPARCVNEADNRYIFDSQATCNSKCPSACQPLDLTVNDPASKDPSTANQSSCPTFICMG